MTREGAGQRKARIIDGTIEYIYITVLRESAARG